jgi:hypothetical protein
MKTKPLPFSREQAILHIPYLIKTTRYRVSPIVPNWSNRRYFIVPINELAACLKDDQSKNERQNETENKNRKSK